MARTLKICIAALVLSVGFIAPTLAEVPSLNQPNWDQLTAEQRAVLQPLAADWPSMESYKRKKWLGIAQRYTAMSPEEKTRVDLRMKEWANLSPEQRQQARTNYKSLKQVPPEHKEDVKRKWEEYSQLPAEQRGQLKADAAHKPPASSTPLVPPSRPPIQAPKPVTPLVPLAGSSVANSSKSPTDGVSPAPTGVQSATPPATKQSSPEKP